MDQENKLNEFLTENKEAGTETAPEAAPLEAPAVDYKAELEKEKKRREKAEGNLSRAEYTLARKNMEDKNPEVIPVADLEKIVDQKLSERLSQVRERDTTEDVDDELMNSTNNPEERELIRFYYENRIVKTGYSRTSIREDIRTCRLLANAKKYEKSNTELSQAMIAKQTLGNSSQGSNLDQPKLSDDFTKEFNSTDLSWMKANNWSEKQMKDAAMSIRQERARKG